MYHALEVHERVGNHVCTAVNVACLWCIIEITVFVRCQKAEEDVCNEVFIMDIHICLQCLDIKHGRAELVALRLLHDLIDFVKYGEGEMKLGDV